MFRLRHLAAAAAAILVVAACSTGASPSASTSPSLVGGSKASVIPLFVSSEAVVGPNRLLFAFIDARTNVPVAAPDRTATFAFHEGGTVGTQPAATAEGKFVWGIEGVRGLYVVNVTLPKAGDWTAEITTSAPNAPAETVPLAFEVREKGSAVRVGDRAPASDTPTAADVGGDLAKLSTDKQPDPAFYELSVADALAARRPFVLVFATPAFCTSQQCGPTLDGIKPLAKEFPDVAFINVEPFELAVTDGRLQPVLDAQGQLKPVQAVRDWGILSEPWAFVVDRDGVVRGSFEGVVGDEELREAIASVAT